MAFVGSSAFLGATALRPRPSAVCTAAASPPVGGVRMVDSLPPAPLKYDAAFSRDPLAARPKDVAPMITLSFASPASDLDGTAKVGLSMAPVLETAAYERYFPTKIRNRAPVISMRPPAGPWDTTAYLTVGSEVVQLNASAARQLTVDAPAADAANVRGSVASEKNFGGDRANVAPVIEIGEESVSVSMQAVAVEEDAAASVAAEASA
eukprot:contig_26483_g6511